MKNIYKDSTINARIDSDLKKQAENILQNLGLSSAEAVRMFYRQICLHNGLPFEVKMPNNDTLKAFADIESGKNFMTASSFDEFKKLLEK